MEGQSLRLPVLGDDRAEYAVGGRAAMEGQSFKTARCPDHLDHHPELEPAAMEGQSLRLPVLPQLRTFLKPMPGRNGGAVVKTARCP